MNDVIPMAEERAQRFRPYRDGQVRLNPKGCYVRWQDYERLREALAKIVTDGDYTAPEGMTRLAKEALGGNIDWDPVFRGTSDYQGCSCYGYEGDSNDCRQHGGHKYPNEASMIRDNGDAP